MVLKLFLHFFGIACLVSKKMDEQDSSSSFGAGTLYFLLVAIV